MGTETTGPSSDSSQTQSGLRTRRRFRATWRPSNRPRKRAAEPTRASFSRSLLAQACSAASRTLHDETVAIVGQSRQIARTLAVGASLGWDLHLRGPAPHAATLRRRL